MLPNSNLENLKYFCILGSRTTSNLKRSVFNCYLNELFHISLSLLAAFSEMVTDGAPLSQLAVIQSATRPGMQVQFSTQGI